MLCVCVCVGLHIQKNYQLKQQGNERVFEGQKRCRKKKKKEKHPAPAATINFSGRTSLEQLCLQATSLLE